MPQIFRLATSFAMGAAASVALAHAQHALDDVEITPTDLGAGLYLLAGAGGNIGVSIGEDGVFMIDDQFAPLSEKISDAIQSLDGGSADFIINTHWHGDHTGGNDNFAAGGATIVAHDNVRLRMSTNQYIKAIDAKVKPRPDIALPVITFTEEVTFHLNGLAAHAIHVPHGHTDGDAMIVFADQKIIHMGDLFFNGNYPFIDTSSGGSIDGMIAGVAQVLEVVDAEWKIIPGHGPLASRDDLEAYHSMLTTVRSLVQAMIDQGKSVDEIIAADPLVEFNAKWGGGFITAERIIKPVHETLTQ